MSPIVKDDSARLKHEFNNRLDPIARAMFLELDDYAFTTYKTRLIIGFVHRTAFEPPTAVSSCLPHYRQPLRCKWTHLHVGPTTGVILQFPADHRDRTYRENRIFVSIAEQLTLYKATAHRYIPPKRKGPRTGASPDTEARFSVAPAIKPSTMPLSSAAFTIVKKSRHDDEAAPTNLVLSRTYSGELLPINLGFAVCLEVCPLWRAY